MTEPDGVPEVADQLPESSPAALRSTVIRLVLVGAYLWVVFGILLPRVVDYGEMLEAFRNVPAQWLLVVFLVGVFGWVAGGLALQAPMPGLSLRRSVLAYLSLAAIGSTMTGAVKLAIGYRIFREWGRSPESTVLGLTLNGIASQASKLLLPAIAFLLLAFVGAVPPTGFLAAFLLAVPIVLGVMVGIWMMRSEAFARRVGAFATRATDSVMRRMHRPAPGDLTDRLLTFREAARDLLLARIVPITLTQLLAQSVGYVTLLLSMRAVGVGSDVLPAEVDPRGVRRGHGDHPAADRARRRRPARGAVHRVLHELLARSRPGTTPSARASCCSAGCRGSCRSRSATSRC